MAETLVIEHSPEWEHLPPSQRKIAAPMTFKQFQTLTNKGFSVWPVGSRTIPGAAHPDSDYDFLALCTRSRRPELFSELGFLLLKGGEHYDPSEGEFNSWKLEDLNIIATDDVEFTRRFLVANDLAKQFKLTRKPDRIKLFQAVLYGRKYL